MVVQSTCSELLSMPKFISTKSAPGPVSAKSKAARLNSRINFPNKQNFKPENTSRESPFSHPLLEGHSAVMLLIDPKTGKIVDANEAARKFYGYSAAQFKRLTIYKINSMDRVELESIVKKILARKCNSFNTRHRLANGEIRDVEVHSSPVDHQTRLLLFAIVTDMAEKMQAGRNLQKMEAEYRDLFEHVLDGVYRSTPRGKLLAVNPAMVHILGYDSAE